MSNPHFALTLRAALVAQSALRTIRSIGPILEPLNDETKGFQKAFEQLYELYQVPRHPAVPAPARRDAGARQRRAEGGDEGLDDDFELEPSAWDPEPLYEASRCQALLMEIIRRATHDWVLYRNHRRIDRRALASQAYTWLFEEEPGHPAWKDRERALFRVEDDESGESAVEVGSRRLTSFLSICEACNLDPEAVRERAREMTVESIMHSGRRIERRRPKNTDSLSIDTHSVVVDVDIDSLDVENTSGSGDYYDSRYGYGSDNAW